MVTAEEKKQITETFTAMDKNNDGVLSKQEIRDGIYLDN